jgi:hypothetical protein
VEEVKVAVVEGRDHQAAAAVNAGRSRRGRAKNILFGTGAHNAAAPYQEGFTKAVSFYINLCVDKSAALFRRFRITHYENTITDLKEWLL